MTRPKGQDTSALESSPTLAAHASAPTLAAPTTWAPDEIVDMRPTLLSERSIDARYDALRTLGAGGMGEVWLCKDRRIGREIAQKRMHGTNALDGAARLRFEREARVQGQLEHPAIVPVYDLGQNDAGETFFTMKRVRGRTLAEVLTASAEGDAEMRRRFSQRRLLSAFSNVCLAVDFAHAHGVLHRDIKPENVMLGDYGEVYLLDWGISRVAAGDTEAVRAEDAAARKVEAPVGAQTVAGAVLGTPGYMSPEQERGAVEELGPTTDVYALGAVLFEILAGERLHRGQNVAELLASTLLGEVESRPSLRAPSADIPPELDALCVRATAVNPNERVPSARSLSEAVEQFLDGDRDSTLRREAASRLAEQATDAARAAIDDDDLGARGRASSQASRALALDPDNRPALEVVFELLTRPPRVVPPEARASLERAQVTAVRAFFRQAVLTFVSYGVFFPILLAVGVREWGTFAALIVTWAATVGLAWAASRVDRAESHVISAFMVAALLLNVLASRFAGPFLFVPIVLAVNLLSLGLNPGRQRHTVYVIASALVVPTLFALERFGILPATSVFASDGLHVIPRLAAFGPGWFATLIVVATVMPILTGASVVNPMIARTETAEAALHLQAWQLRQMLPERAAASRVSSVLARPSA
jgi:serine/threonine-protein kinase